MILLIDNYDSFSYNLFQLVGSIDPEIQVVRNDKITLEEIEALAPTASSSPPDRANPVTAAFVRT